MEEKEYVQQLRDGRVFFDYGPVSMVVSALRGGRPDTALCRSAFSVIERCLCELSPQLEMLRRYPPEVETDRLSGAALIMAQAVLDAADPWLTPMAAVAGTLSDAVADYLWDQGAEKVIVNNGGDIALRLAPGQRLGLGVRYDLSRDSIDRVIHLDRQRSGRTQPDDGNRQRCNRFCLAMCYGRRPGYFTGGPFLPGTARGSYPAGRGDRS